MFAIAFLILSAAPSLGNLNDNINATCNCQNNKKNDGWCSVCKIGYLATLEIKSSRLFEALDAHGHEVQVERFICDTCKTAHKTDGYCDTCRIGFVNQKAYLSRITYEIARGLRVSVDDLPCDQCKKLASKYGWCDDCGCGFVGNIAITSRATYTIAEAAWKNLLASLELLAKCETCAVAQFTGGSCLTCKLTYKTGKPEPLSTRKP